MHAAVRSLVLAGIVLAAAGCGSSGSSSTSSTESWANSLCSAVTTYDTALKAAGSSLQSSGISESSLRRAVGDVNDATDTFISSLKGLGKPDTAAGAQAKDSVDALTSQLQQDASSIRTATADVSTLSGALTAAVSVTATASGASTQITDTWNSLQQLDAKGELSQAFSNAQSCTSLKGK